MITLRKIIVSTIIITSSMVNLSYACNLQNDGDEYRITDGFIIKSSWSNDLQYILTEREHLIQTGRCEQLRNSELPECKIKQSKTGMYFLKQGPYNSLTKKSHNIEEIINLKNIFTDNGLCKI
jgi:hypothetical protein